VLLGNACTVSVPHMRAHARRGLTDARSELKRLMSRPLGVLSNQSRGALSTRPSIRPCSCRDARRDPAADAIARSPTYDQQAKV